MLAIVTLCGTLIFLLKENIMSKEIVMNGPASFSMSVFITNDETGQNAKVDFSLGHFEYPTKEKVSEKVASVIDAVNDSGTTGFRLMTKEEAFNHLCAEEYGVRLACPNGDWDNI